MLRKVLKLFSNAKTEIQFSEEDIKKIEAVIKLHYTWYQRVRILHQDMFKILDEIFFLTGKDLIAAIDFQFKRSTEIYKVKDGWITELENPKKGLGVFLVVNGQKGYYYIKGVSGNEAYVELCGTMDTHEQE